MAEIGNGLIRIDYSWTQLKSIVAAKRLSLQYEESSNAYELFALDGSIAYVARIFTGSVPDSSYSQVQNDADKSDFETNYKNVVTNRILQSTAATDGYAVSTTSPMMIAGSDGSLIRTILTDSSGNLKAVGTGIAGTPSGGVLTVQGVSGGTALKVDGSAVTQPVSGTVSIGANSSVNLNQIAGTTTATGNGVAGAGVQRVAIVSDNTAFSVNSVQSGTWTVQPGNTANTTAWLVNDSSNGTVTPGTAATKSSLIGGQFNTTLPTLTTGQQAAIQVDSSGRIIIGALATGSNTIGAVTQSGTWTVQPGNTANTTPWLTTISQGGNSATVSAGGALKVDGSAVTQPVSGTITANIGTSGSLALDATLAKLTIAQGAATGTNTQALAGAVATTAAPTYTTATINPLSLTTAGALRVDGSAVTQPVSGTVSITANSAVNLAQIAGVATSTGNGVAGTGVQRVTIASDNTAFSVNAVQSGTWTVQPGNTANTTAWLVNDSSNGTVTPGTAATKSSLIGAQFNTTLPTLTTGQQAALQADSSGRLLIGALSTGSNTIGAVTQSGTWTIQPGNTANTTPWLATISQGGNSATVSAGGALKVDGSAVTQPVSGTITANIGTSGSLALDATLAKLTIAQGAATGTNTQALAGAVATSAAPTYTTATINPLSLTTAGALRVDASATTQPVSGTVSITANSSVNLNQIAGTTTATGNGVAGTGVQRVTIASDNTAFSVNAVQSGTWTVQPGNTANTTAWLVNDSSNGTVTPGTAATKSSLIGAQFNTSLPTLTTGQQAALQADSSGRLLIGALATGSNTIGAVTGTGTAGSPAGGVLTIQGVSGGTAIPVSGTFGSSEAATFNVVSSSTAVANNKSMVSLVNTTGSTVTVKIHEIYLINVQNTSGTGTAINFELRKIVTHTGGSSITPLALDSADSLNGSVTCRTGATVGTEGAIYWRNVWSSDDWQIGSVDIESSDHTSQTLFPMYSRKTNGTKPITLRANEGLSLKCATNTTSGSFDVLIVFTQE